MVRDASLRDAPHHEGTDATGGQERARATRRARLRMRKSRGAAEIEQAQALIALWPGAHKLGGCNSYEGSNQCDDAENKRCPV